MRKGRGQLSKIQLLPDAAQPIVQWAAKELAGTKRIQKDILIEFNEKLHEIDPNIEPISSSAFSRHSVRLSSLNYRMAQSREIAAALSKNITAKTSDELTIVAAEAIKTLILELTDEPNNEPLEAMRLASALKQANQAEHVSSDRRTKVDKDFKDAASKAIDAVGRQKGISSETVEDIKRSFLGIKVTK